MIKQHNILIFQARRDCNYNADNFSYFTHIISIFELHQNKPNRLP